MSPPRVCWPRQPRLLRRICLPKKVFKSWYVLNLHNPMARMCIDAGPSTIERVLHQRRWDPYRYSIRRYYVPVISIPQLKRRYHYSSTSYDNRLSVLSLDSDLYLWHDNGTEHVEQPHPRPPIAAARRNRVRRGLQRVTKWDSPSLSGSGASAGEEKPSVVTAGSQNAPKYKSYRLPFGI